MLQLTQTQFNSETDTNPFRYCGEYFDNETELIYLRARYYDPYTQRFCAEDQITSGTNWYSYCHNDPVNFCDPLGFAEKLRDLVAQTTGNVEWVGENNWFGFIGTKNTATVEIDGKKQKYAVKGGLVYLNDEQVGYIENDSIMIEEEDFNKDFEIIGIITINSYYNPNEKLMLFSAESSIISGHAWVAYESIEGSSNFVTANSQTYMGSNFTVSSWNGGNETMINRTKDAEIKDSEFTAMKSVKITKSQQKIMLQTIENKATKGWSINYPCSSFAIDVFKETTGLSFHQKPSNSNGYALPSVMNIMMKKKFGPR